MHVMYRLIKDEKAIHNKESRGGPGSGEKVRSAQTTLHKICAMTSILIVDFEEKALLKHCNSGSCMCCFPHLKVRLLAFRDSAHEMVKLFQEAAIRT